MRYRKRSSKTKNGVFRSGFYDQKKKLSYLKKSYIFFSDRKTPFFVFDLRIRSRIRSGLRRVLSWISFFYNSIRTYSRWDVFDIT